MATDEEKAAGEELAVLEQRVESRIQAEERARRKKARRGNLNALKHGLASPHPVIVEGIETVEDWLQFEEEIIESLAPETALEERLAERVALLLWRLKRLAFFESAVVNHQVAETKGDLQLSDMYGAGTLTKEGAKPPEIAPNRLLAYKLVRLVPLGSRLETVLRYEASLHRQCLQTLHELEALQAQRRGQPTRLARLDISTPPVV